MTIAGDEIARFLLANGADRVFHAQGRTLLEHLLGTRTILSAWNEPQWLRDAGALHSIYATDAYPHQLIAFSRRDEVRAVSSARAERLAYHFAVVQRVPFFETVARRAPDFPDELDVAAICPDGSTNVTLARPEISSLLLLHVANALEQERGVAEEPHLWPAWIRRLESLVHAEVAVSPALIAADVGRSRFRRYVDAFPNAGNAALRTPYPDLRSTPWHDPARFPLVRALEREYAAIRSELLGLERAEFRPERERIRRRGAWEAMFLYQRGRKHVEVCARCPVTTRIVEAYGLRSPAGLIYVSRLAAGAEVAPHCGPTNVRLRCHLGLQVPAGDCALRVDGEARGWEEGRCLVFDDSFVHDAWNRTPEDRLVLIVDLWHPDLTENEIASLQGLQRYALGYAHQYEDYWAVNEG